MEHPQFFFTASRGLRQGYPLSPLWFILVIEGLSILIKDAKSNGMIGGIKISTSLSLTHLLFVDDVVLFGIDTLEECVAFEVILDTFFLASGMSIILDKSGFLFNNVEVDILNSITFSLPYKFDHIMQGF